jgi:hypothetical protein
MTDPKLEAHRVTKPIQLLAAWLVGLITVDAAFLAAAEMIASPVWIRSMLAIAAVCNVPIFLFCIFLLQTRFRPQMQEDVYYSQYLKDSMTQKSVTMTEEVSELRQLTVSTNSTVLSSLRDLQGQIVDLARLSQAGTDVESSGHDTEPTALALLEERTKQIEERFELALERSEAEQTSVEINDLLPAYPALLAQITALGLSVGHTFGSTSSPPDIPNLFVMTITPGINVGIAQKLISAAKRVGLQGLQVGSDRFGTGRLYLGSYGYKHRNYALVTEGLIARLLVPGISESELLAAIAEASDQPPAE